MNKNKYKVYYERMFDDENLDSVASTQSIEVEAENESELLGKKGLLVKENFFELGLVGQGCIVDEYLRKIDYDDLQEVLSIIAEREIKEGNSRHDFMEAASSAYSDLKDDDE